MGNLPVRMTKKFWNAYGALYGKEEEKKDVTKNVTNRSVARSVSSPPKVTCPTEHQEQAIFCTWMDRNEILYFAIPNGGYRNALEGVKFKREGVKRGVPDISLPVPSKSGFNGLYIEMKRKWGGKVSEEQMEWGRKLMANGYEWKVARGAEEAIEVVKNYLKPNGFVFKREGI